MRFPFRKGFRRDRSQSGHRSSPGDGPAEAGSDVVLLVRDTGGAAEVIKELDALGVTAIAVTADVTEPDQVRRAAGEVMDRLGQVDVLVNNAGACIHRPSLGVTAEEWRFVMDVNVNGVWNCAQEFGRQMVAQHSGHHQHRLDLGQIVNRPQWQPCTTLQRLRFTS